MAGETSGLKWWDWVFSLPPIIACYLTIQFALSFLDNPSLESRVTTYSGYALLLVSVVWYISWTRRFGWRKGLPPELGFFWLAVMLVEFLLWASLRQLAG